jgi:hypothetical protein
VLTVAGCAIIACGDAALLQADWGSETKSIIAVRA